MQKASSCLLLGGGLLQRGDRRRQDLGLLWNAGQTIGHTSMQANQVQQIKATKMLGERLGTAGDSLLATHGPRTKRRNTRL